MRPTDVNGKSMSMQVTCRTERRKFLCNKWVKILVHEMDETSHGVFVDTLYSVLYCQNCIWFESSNGYSNMKMKNSIHKEWGKGGGGLHTLCSNSFSSVWVSLVLAFLRAS